MVDSCSLALVSLPLPQVNPPIPIPRSIVYPSPISTPPLPEFTDFPNTLPDFVDTTVGPLTHFLEPQLSPEQLVALEYIHTGDISINNQSSTSCTAQPSTVSAVASGPLP